MSQRVYWESERKGFLRGYRPSDNKVVNAYMKSKLKYISEVIPFNKDLTLLDVGCGNGRATHSLTKLCKVVALDFSYRLLRENPAKSKVLADANKLPFLDSSFDIVFESALLHHVNDMLSVSLEMARVTSDYVVFLEPNPLNPAQAMFAMIVPEERKTFYCTLKKLKKVMENSGLKVITAFSCDMIAPNKTPSILLPFLNQLNFKQPFGLDNILIGRKT